MDGGLGMILQTRSKIDCIANGRKGAALGCTELAYHRLATVDADANSDGGEVGIALRQLKVEPGDCGFHAGRTIERAIGMVGLV